MFCPKCASTYESDDLKFCKTCGANLNAVRTALAHPEKTEAKFDWSKTWLAEMMLSGEEHMRRKREHEDPERQRYNEIKAGVITGCVGIALMIFLAIFMNAIAETVKPDVGAILRHIWVAGVIPFFVGLALIFNGVVVSKKLVELRQRELQEKETARISGATAKNTADMALPASDWYEADSPSVTEHTTRQLRDSDQRQ